MQTVHSWVFGARLVDLNQKASLSSSFENLSPDLILSFVPFSEIIAMASQSSPKTRNSETMDTPTPRAPSKSNQTRASSRSVRIQEPVEIAVFSPSPPAGQGRQPQAGRPMGGGRPHPEAGHPPVRWRAPSRALDQRPSCTPVRAVCHILPQGFFPIGKS